MIPGTAYTVRLVSNCPAGTSVPSNLSFTTTGTAPCNDPTNLAVGSITAVSASLSFVAGSPGATYTVTLTPATGTPTTVTGTTSPIALNSLTPSTTYTVSVTGRCASGVTTTA